jgi:hypothetical protein
MHKSAKTTDWAEAQVKLKELVLAADSPADQRGEQPVRESMQVQRGFAKQLRRHDIAGATVRIPRTSPSRSNSRTFGRLLTRVDPYGLDGFGFEGTWVTPGDLLPTSSLWPTAQHPPTPIMLECAGCAHPKSGHRRPEQEDTFIPRSELSINSEERTRPKERPARDDQADTYILWRFDVELREWKEIARSSSNSWTWALDLRPIAVRLIEESRGKEFVVYFGFEQVVGRIRKMHDEMARELHQLAPPDRQRATAVLHDELSFFWAQFSKLDDRRMPSAAFEDTIIELVPIDPEPLPG